MPACEYMNKQFCNMLVDLRQKHFPGKSLEELPQELIIYFGLDYAKVIGQYENGRMPECSCFVQRFKPAYSLSDDECLSLLELYEKAGGMCC